MDRRCLSNVLRISYGQYTSSREEDAMHMGRNLYFVYQIFDVKFVGQSKEDLYIFGVELETTFRPCIRLGCTLFL